MSAAAERSRLAAAVRQCGAALARRKEDGTPLDDGQPLRELQKVVRSVTEVEGEPFLSTVAFLLDAWIADYYYNFAGDVPANRSEDIAKVRGRFNAGEATEALGELASAVVGDSVGTMEAFVRLVSAYLKAVREANAE